MALFEKANYLFVYRFVEPTFPYASLKRFETDFFFVRDERNNVIKFNMQLRKRKEWI